MKKGIIASLVALTSGAAIAVFALRGPDKLVDLRVNAETQEYSITFDAKSNIDDVDGDWIISTTTPRGSKVGVMGLDNTAETGLSFCDYKCHALFVFDIGPLGNAGVNDFDNITGFTVVFEGFGLMLSWGESEMHHEQPENGKRLDVTCTPNDHPIFEGHENKITSLTVHYTC